MTQRRLLLLAITMLGLSAGTARAWRLGWALSPGAGARRAHWGVSLGSHSDGGSDGGGCEGIAAHNEAMESFVLEDALLYADDDLIVVNKPPNALCVPGRYIQDSLVVRVAEHFSIQVRSCTCLEWMQRRGQ